MAAREVPSPDPVRTPESSLQPGIEPSRFARAQARDKRARNAGMRQAPGALAHMSAGSDSSKANMSSSSSAEPSPLRCESVATPKEVEIRVHEHVKKSTFFIRWL